MRPNCFKYAELLFSEKDKHQSSSVAQHTVSLENWGWTSVYSNSNLITWYGPINQASVRFSDTSGLNFAMYLQLDWSSPVISQTLWPLCFSIQSRSSVCRIKFTELSEIDSLHVTMYYTVPKLNFHKILTII